VGDQLLVLADALGAEPGLRVPERDEALRRRIHQRGRGHVDAARHPPGPAGAAGLEPPMELRSQRVDHHRPGLPRGREYHTIVDEETGAGTGRESGWRITSGGAALDRPAFRLPSVEA